MFYIKHIVLFSILLLSINNNYAQITNEIELQRLLKGRGMVSQVEDNIYKVEYIDGFTRYYNLNNSHISTEVEDYPTTTINIQTIDTTQFEGMYYLWTEIIGLGNADRPIFVDDINDNDLKELYLFYLDFNSPPEEIALTVYEYIPPNNNFLIIHKYPQNFGFAITKDKMTSNDEFELLVYQKPPTAFNIFRKSNDTSLATIDYLKYQLNNQQINNVNVIDLNNNGLANFIFNNSTHTFILEFNPKNNSFDTLKIINHNSIFASGYSIGDFNQNHYNEIVFGTIHGKVYIYEAYIDSIVKIWEKQFDTQHPYYFTKTKDYDKNGKPEIWILSEIFENNQNIVKLYALEKDSIEGYKIKYLIKLLGTGFFGGSGSINSVVIDESGDEKLLICFDNAFLILEFNESKKEFEVYYLDVKEENEGNSIYYAAIAHDLDNNGQKEILLSADLVANNSIKYFTRIFKEGKKTSVLNEKIIKELNINVFPNPFNNNAKITVSQITNEKLSIYNLLGEKVKEIESDYFDNSNTIYSWDGKNESGHFVSSGIYFITLQLNENIYTNKIIFNK